MWNWLGVTNDPKTGEVGVENLNGENTDKTVVTETKDDKTTTQTPPDNNMKEVAANLGNYLYNFASVATKTASKLKDTVDEKLEKTIVGDFNRENERFIQERDTRRIGDAVPPWVGFHEEEVMKQQIIALSSDERNFLRDPPTGVDFQFDLAQMMPIALSVLKEDKDLEKMRFSLVPRRIKEEPFWKNYFYRVSLIKQSTQLSTISGKESKGSPRNSSSEIVNKNNEKPDATNTPTTDDLQQDDHNLDDVAGQPAHEFASDAFDENAHLSEEEKTQMLLGVTEKKDAGQDSTNNDWEIEKELQDELENFELVDNNDAGDNEDDDEWQKEIEDLLEEDSNPQTS